MILCLCALPAAAPAAAAAQSDHDSATARALFEQGVDLAGRGDWSGAADRFARSNELRRSPVVAYNLASARVELGQLVEAVELLRQIEKDAAAKPKLKKDARVLLARLEPRIGTLVVTVEADKQPEEVRVNDRALPQAALGVPTPVDPGSVEIAVVGSGQVLWTKRVEVLPGGTQRVTIELPEAQQTETTAVPMPAPSPRTTAAALPSEPDAVLTTGTEGEPRDEPGTLWEEPWLWVGAGAVVVGAVVVIVLVASSGGTSTEKPAGGDLEPGQIRVPL